MKRLIELKKSTSSMLSAVAWFASVFCQDDAQRSIQRRMAAIPVGNTAEGENSPLRTSQAVSDNTASW